MGPFVSIITGTYKRPEYLHRAISSALRSTYPRFELIVTDNGNSADNRAIVASFEDPRIRYRANAHNLGIAGNYLAAFREMRGDYFAVLADDDEWEPDFLATLVPVLQANPDVGVACCDHYIIDENGAIDIAATDRASRHFRRDRLTEGKYDSLALLGLIWVSIHMGAAALVRRSAIDFDEFPLAVQVAFDLWLCYQAGKRNAKVYYSPKRLTRYRIHSNSGSIANFAAEAKDRIFVYSRILHDKSFPEYEAQFRWMLSLNHVDCGIALLKRGRLREGSHHLFCGLRMGGWARLAKRGIAYAHHLVRAITEWPAQPIPAHHVEHRTGEQVRDSKVHLS
jgi:GT2 family glycosyltransferase